MEALTLFLTMALPAGLVLFAMYLVVKSFLTKEFEKKLVEVRLKNKELILPARMQAYERVCLLLERISPNNLVLRVNDPSMTAGELHQRLLIEIREEFNHNLSQQVYMSDQSWDLVKQAVQDVTTIVNRGAEHVAGDARGVELAKAIFEDLIQQNQDPMRNALTFVKNEIRQLY